MDDRLKGGHVGRDEDVLYVEYDAAPASRLWVATHAPLAVLAAAAAAALAYAASGLSDAVVIAGGFYILRTLARP